MKNNLSKFLPSTPQIKRTVNPNGLEVAPNGKAQFNGSEFEFKQENSIGKGGLYFKDVSLTEGLNGTKVIVS